MPNPTPRPQGPRARDAAWRHEQARKARMHVGLLASDPGVGRLARDILPVLEAIERRTRAAQLREAAERLEAVQP